jgi:serine/threonine-protein kinase
MGSFDEPFFHDAHRIISWYIMLLMATNVHCQAPGTITTIAGTGVAGYLGDGGQSITAQLNNPIYISYDATGAIIIPDCNNFRIRRIDLASSIITTIAGNGVQGYSGDGGLATSASLKGPQSALYAPDGCLYFSDNAVSVIRKVDTKGYISTIAGTGEEH